MDFHYDGVDYSIPGNTQILLTDLIETMQITVPDGDEDPDNDPLLDVNDVESVVFSDEHLVEVTQVSGLITIYGQDGKLTDVDAGEYNFLLSSLAPFSTEEKLTITLKDGTVIEVGVTDAQTILTVSFVDENGNSINQGLVDQSNNPIDGKYYYLMAETLSDNGTPYFRIYRMKNFDSIAIQDSDKYNCEASWDEVYLNASSDIKSLKIVYAGSDQYGYKAGGPFYDATNVGDYTVKELPASITGNTATIKMQGPAAYPVTLNFYDALAVREGEAPNYTVSGDPKEFAAQGQNEKFYVRVYCNDTDGKRIGYALVEVDIEGKTTLQVPVSKFKAIDENGNDLYTTFLYNPAEHVITANDTRFITDKNNTYNLSNNPNYQIVSNSNLDYATPEGWEAFANINNADGGNTISVRKAKEKEYVVRINIDPPTATQGSTESINITDSDDIYLLVKAVHTTGGTGYYLQKLVLSSNDPVEIHVDKWYYDNGNERVGEVYTGGEIDVTPYIVKPKVGKTISSIGNALDTMNTADEISVGQEIKVYGYTSLDNSDKTNIESDPNDPTREFHIDTITLSAPQGTIKRSDIMNAVANARHFGFYTLDWLGHEADMESNGAAWHVSFTNVGSDWGFSGNNLRNNKIFVSKEYVDAEGNPVANRTIKLKLVMIKKEAMSDGGIGGDSTTEWIQEVTTDSNGRVTTTFPGLYSGTYRVYEEINGTWVAWNSSVKVFGEGASKVTVTFLDEDGNVIELGDNPTEHDIVLSNTNYYVYFGDLSNVPDETIKDLITKARSGSGKKFVVQASDYDRVSALNNALSVSNRATILVAGQHGAPNYNMPADFESYIALSRRLATEQSSSTVRVLNIKASEIGDAIDLIDDGRFLVINVDTQGADVVKTKLRLHGDQYPDGAVTVTAHFNQDGYNWSSRILWNILDGTEPTTRTVNTGENSSGIFLIPAGQTSTLGGNWGGTIIAGKYYHTGAEIHSEQWDDDIDMGKAAMRNLLGNGTSAELSAEKKFENWGDEDKFTFVLEQEDTAPMPVDSVNDDGVKYSEASSEDKAVGGFTKTVVLTKPLHGDEATALFGSMVYASSGTYKYRIKEVIPAAEDRGDITYDETVYTVTVHVTADDSGDLSVSYSMTANPAKTPSVDYTEQTTYTAPVLINAREEAGVGSLKLKKTLTINGAAATEDTVQYLSEDSYTFTFTITGADNNTVTGFTYYDDNGDLVTAEQNSITLTLNKSGDTWTVADLSKELKLSNLPAGTYILTETAPSAPVSLTGRAQIDVNGTAVSTGDAVPEDTNSIKVEVVAGEDTNVQTAAFTNDAGKGKLSIKKTVTGDVNVGPFTFTVKNTDTNKYYTVTGNANTVNLVAEGSANDTAQTVSVGKGYTLTITDLPFGHYEVVETGKYEYEGYIWTKTMTPENGQVTVTDATDATPVEVTVDNAYVKEGKGMLKLYKSFSFDGMPIDLNNLTEAQKTALRNLTFTVKKGDQYVTWDNATAGEGNIHGRWAKLDDRESSFNYFDDFRDGMLVLENLPTGTYTITENGTDAFVGYTWTLGTVQVNRDGTLVEHENPTSVEVTNVQVNPLDAVNGDFTQVFFANTYKQNVGQLSVIKALDVKDEAGVAVAAPGTEFTDKTYRVAVYAKDDEENRTYYATNGKALNKTENQWVEIKSGEDKKVTWTNLPIGTYYVEEFYDEADVDGYTRTTTITVGETETDIVEVGDNPVTAAAVDVPIYDEDDTTTVKLATITNAYTRDKGTLKVNKKVFVNNTDATSNNTDKVFYMKVQYVEPAGADMPRERILLYIDFLVVVLREILLGQIDLLTGKSRKPRQILFHPPVHRHQQLPEQIRDHLFIAPSAGNQFISHSAKIIFVFSRQPRAKYVAVQRDLIILQNLPDLTHREMHEPHLCSVLAQIVIVLLGPFLTVLLLLSSQFCIS